MKRWNIDSADMVDVLLRIVTAVLVGMALGALLAGCTFDAGAPGQPESPQCEAPCQSVDGFCNDVSEALCPEYVGCGYAKDEAACHGKVRVVCCEQLGGCEDGKVMPIDYDARVECLSDIAEQRCVDFLLGWPGTCDEAGLR